MMFFSIDDHTIIHRDEDFDIFLNLPHLDLHEGDRQYKFKFEEMDLGLKNSIRYNIGLTTNLGIIKLKYVTLTEKHSIDFLDDECLKTKHIEALEKYFTVKDEDKEYIEITEL